MLSKIFFFTIRTLCRFIRDFDGLFSTISFKLFKTRYKIKGNCKQCGNCCTKIAIYLSNGFWEYPFLKKLAIKWYTFTYNFQLIDQDPELKIIIFKCNYLKNQKCSIYFRRPFICRNYPEVRYFDEPVFLPECGYYISPK